MRKTIVTIGASVLLLLVNVMPVFANDVQTHLDAAKAATQEVVNHLDLAAASTTGDDMNTHTNEALVQMVVVGDELSQVSNISVDWNLLVRMRLVNNTLERARMLAQTTLDAPNMRKWSRAWIARSYGHILQNVVNGLN